MSAMVHTTSDCLHIYQLEEVFISTFLLGTIKKCIFIIGVENIIAPLCVFKEYGGRSSKYFCSVPSRKYGQLFSGQIDLPHHTNTRSENNAE